MYVQRVEVLHVLFLSNLQASQHAADPLISSLLAIVLNRLHGAMGDFYSFVHSTVPIWKPQPTNISVHFTYNTNLLLLQFDKCFSTTALVYAEFDFKTRGSALIGQLSVQSMPLPLSLHFCLSIPLCMLGWGGFFYTVFDRITVHKFLGFQSIFNCCPYSPDNCPWRISSIMFQCAG